MVEEDCRLGVEEDEMHRAFSTHLEKRNAHMTLVGRTEGKRTLGGLKGKWIYSTKMEAGAMGWAGTDRIDLAQERENWGSCKCGNEHSSPL
jgi:hypothetical protein